MLNDTSWIFAGDPLGGKKSPIWLAHVVTGPPLPIREEHYAAWTEFLDKADPTLTDITGIAHGRLVAGRLDVPPFSPTVTLRLVALMALLGCEPIGAAPLPCGKFGWSERFQAVQAPDMLGNLTPDLSAALVQWLSAMLAEARWHRLSAEADITSELSAAILCYQKLLVRLLPAQPMPEGALIFRALLGEGPPSLERDDPLSVTSLLVDMVVTPGVSAHWLRLAFQTLLYQTGDLRMFDSLRDWYTDLVVRALLRHEDGYDAELLQEQIALMGASLQRFRLEEFGTAARLLLGLGESEPISASLRLLIEGVLGGPGGSMAERLCIQSQGDLDFMQVVLEIVREADWSRAPGYARTLEDLIRAGVSRLAEQATQGQQADQACAAAWAALGGVGS